MNEEEIRERLQKLIRWPSNYKGFSAFIEKNIETLIRSRNYEGFSAFIEKNKTNPALKTALLITNRDGESFLHEVVTSKKITMPCLEKIFTLALFALTKSKTTPEEIKAALLEKDGYGTNVLHHTAISGSSYLFSAALVALKDVATPAEIKAALVEQDDDTGLNVLHHAAKSRNSETFSAALSALRKSGANSKEIKNDLFAKDTNGQNILFKAASSGGTGLFSAVLVALRESGATTEEIKNDLFTKDINGKNVLHHAAESQNSEMFTGALDALKESRVNSEEIKNALVIRDRFERSALHHAAILGNSEIFSAVLVALKDVATPEEVKTALLEKNGQGSNVLRETAILGHTEIFTLALDALYESINGSQDEKDQEIARVLSEKNQYPSIRYVLEYDRVEYLIPENVRNILIASELQTTINESFAVYTRNPVEHDNPLYTAAAGKDEKEVESLQIMYEFHDILDAPPTERNQILLEGSDAENTSLELLGNE